MGDCFVVAAHLARQNEWDLCHGIVDHPETGRHWHAWCEFEEEIPVPPGMPAAGWRMAWVVDRANGNDFSGPALVYYQLGRIRADEIWRYSPLEATHLMLRHRHWGPWVSDAEDPLINR
jgi:hypothetical protein